MIHLNEGFTSVADQEFAETGDYDVYSDTPTYSTPAPTYSYEGSDEQDEARNYSAPTYQESPAYSGGDSGGSYDGADSMSDYSSDPTGYSGSFAVGGIVRLRKNKQNSRIHDRRKRLAMGGIASLHG